MGCVSNLHAVVVLLICIVFSFVAGFLVGQGNERQP